MALKMASTGYRFARYYTGDPQHRSAGRAIADVAHRADRRRVHRRHLRDGNRAMAFGPRFGSIWVEAHKLSFRAWLPAIGAHVTGHGGRTSQAAAEELSLSSPANAITRRSLVVVSLITGVVRALSSLTYSTPFIFFRVG